MLKEKATSAPSLRSTVRLLSWNGVPANFCWTCTSLGAGRAVTVVARRAEAVAMRVVKYMVAVMCCLVCYVLVLIIGMCLQRIASVLIGSVFVVSFEQQ